MPRIVLLTLALIVAGCTTTPAPPPHCDLWIRGGDVIDGSGAPQHRADVLIDDGRILYIGHVPTTDAEAAIDATGLCVAPGFIDPHAHGDPRRTPGFANFTCMGVTTLCLGQDGTSPGGIDFERWQEQVERGRFAVNVAPLIGHGTVRRLAGVGMSDAPTDEGIEAMVELVAAAMRAGAFGMSTGLEYEPGRFASADELLRVARPVAAHDGVVMSHVRSEDEDQVLASIDELLTQCRDAGCRAHVSHVKVVYGRDTKRANAVLSKLADARAAGMQVTADLYPYAASYTGIGIVFPPWARPPNDYAEVVRTRRAELAAHLRQRVHKRNGPDAIVIGDGQWAGRSLASIAAELEQPFEDVLIDELGPRGPAAAHFVMSEEVVRALLLADVVVVGSDGSPTMRHPRGYGTFAKVVREFVVERQLLTLEQAVHKMTGATAALLGLDRGASPRGLLRPGFAADVVCFDPQRVQDHATFSSPFERALGFEFVLVNGVPVVANGEPTKHRPGHLLRHAVAP